MCWLASLPPAVLRDCKYSSLARKLRLMASGLVYLISFYDSSMSLLTAPNLTAQRLIRKKLLNALPLVKWRLMPYFRHHCSPDRFTELTTFCPNLEGFHRHYLRLK